MPLFWKVSRERAEFIREQKSFYREFADCVPNMTL